jgi:hypothetical protein
MIVVAVSTAAVARCRAVPVLSRTLLIPVVVPVLVLAGAALVLLLPPLPAPTLVF